MGSEVEAETREEAGRMRRPKSVQKLSLFSLPVPQQSSDPPGMLTPPFKSAVSVPFLWEEAPGKPLLSSNSSSSSASSAIARCLELPPRLQLTESSNNTPSPTTVLDGPYVGRSSSFTSSSIGKDPLPLIGFSFRRETENPNGTDGIFQLESLSHSKRRGIRSCSRRSYFGFSGRKAFSSLNSKPNQDVAGEGDTNSKVKITGIKRTGSFFSLSQTKSSHLWASIYEGFKQVVPWRSKTKKDKDSLINPGKMQ